mmetsp:Transcript_23422/g.92835  ORF Transcript_23422/g.92835 Transcript_23422/m.92835 type:complete len:220 (-) Transcript_23422:447-1106(-)
MLRKERLQQSSWCYGRRLWKRSFPQKAWMGAYLARTAAATSATRDCGTTRGSVVDSAPAKAASKAASSKTRLESQTARSVALSASRPRTAPRAWRRTFLWSHGGSTSTSRARRSRATTLSAHRPAMSAALARSAVRTATADAAVVEPSGKATRKNGRTRLRLGGGAGDPEVVLLVRLGGGAKCATETSIAFQNGSRTYTRNGASDDDDDDDVIVAPTRA